MVCWFSTMTTAAFYAISSGQIGLDFIQKSKRVMMHCISRQCSSRYIAMLDLSRYFINSLYVHIVPLWFSCVSTQRKGTTTSSWDTYRFYHFERWNLDIVPFARGSSVYIVHHHIHWIINQNVSTFDIYIIREISWLYWKRRERQWRGINPKYLWTVFSWSVHLKVSWFTFQSRSIWPSLIQIQSETAVDCWWTIERDGAYFIASDIQIDH